MDTELRLLDPREWDAEKSRKLAERAAAAHVDARARRHARDNADKAAYYAGLRTAFLAVPGVEAALAAGRPAKPAPRPLPAPATAGASLRLDAHTIETAPFLTTSGVSSTGPNTIIVQVLPSGSVSLNLEPGVVRPSNLGNGAASCFGGVGAAFEVPGSVGGIQFATTCNFNWGVDWTSQWWRETKGDVWVGHLINRFRPDGSFLDQPVASQLVQPGSVFDDYNLDDSGGQLGSQVGYTLISTIATASPVILECFFWVGTSASADPNQSFANTQIAMNLTSMSIDAL